MSERKIPICPLILIASDMKYSHCRLDRCAFYNKEREECAIVLLSRDLRLILEIFVAREER